MIADIRHEVSRPLPTLPAASRPRPTFPKTSRLSSVLLGAVVFLAGSWIRPSRKLGAFLEKTLLRVVLVDCRKVCRPRRLLRKPGTEVHSSAVVLAESRKKPRLSSWPNSTPGFSPPEESLNRVLSAIADHCTEPTKLLRPAERSAWFR